MKSSVLFLGFAVSSKGVEVDPDKVKVIRDWPIPTTLNEVCSFHGLATFYRHFIKNFNTIMALITSCLKKGQFVWRKATLKAFEEIKQWMIEAPILGLLDFSKVFEVTCDAS